MARFKITLEYDGTRYRGWQAQKECRTIQGACIEAMAGVFKTRQLDFQGSGRTDAGVHALRQVAHLDIHRSHDISDALPAINEALPADIHFLAMEKTTSSFHARHDAVARSYVYQIATRRTAFAKRYVWWIRDLLDVAAMRAASRHFVGLKNFQSFTLPGGEAASTKVDLSRIRVESMDDLVLIRLVGSHFLWKMVRQIVGQLVEVGRGRFSEKDLGRLFETYSHSPAETTAPPSGLFLENVYYKGDQIPEEVRPAFFTGSAGLVTSRR